MKLFSLVVFVPSSHANSVREALANSGAGAIGNYDSCSFSSEGIGRYRPLENSSPAIGVHGTLEEVPETRVEVVVEESHLSAVLRSLKQAHRYEEPAIHLTEIIDYKSLMASDESKKPVSSALTRFGPISIVIEGLDGVGKSTVCERLAEMLSAKHLVTPPAIMRPGREWFVKQDNHMRKAYYMVGNFIAGAEMQEAVSQGHNVVLDRYLASTIAYITGKKDTHLPLPEAGDAVFAWPEELYVPSCMVVLVLPEEDRVRRHQSRTSVDETPEEKLLREDPLIAARINECYARMGCRRVDLLASDDVDAVVNKIIEAVAAHLSEQSS